MVLDRLRSLLDRTGDPRDHDHPVRIGDVTLRNPVIASSGTYGYGLEYQRYGDPRLLGAMVLKSLTVDPRPGFDPPRVTLLADHPGSMRNAIGVPNPGVVAWGETILPRLLAAGAPVVASVWGTEAQAVVDAGRLLARYPGPRAWEANLSCPNSGHGGPPVSHDPDAAGEVCRALRELAPPDAGLWAKLSPDTPDVVAVARACRAGGADAVTVSNTYPAAALRPDEPHELGGGAGGLSGAILRPHARALVEKLVADDGAPPVIACGGVLSSADAVDYLRLGAVAVQVGTASLFDPRACHKIARGTVRRLRGDEP